MSPDKEAALEAWATWGEQSEPGTDWESFWAGWRAHRSRRALRDFEILYSAGRDIRGPEGLRPDPSTPVRYVVDDAGSWLMERANRISADRAPE